MKKSINLLCLTLSFIAFSNGVFAEEWASSGMVAQRFYDHAHRNNPQAIARMQRNGYHIDSMDMSGDTAYCLAVKKKDKRAVALLKLYGASVNHNCMRQFQEEKKLEYNKGFVWKNRYIVGGALIAGGAVALAAGGGSGGGGSGSGGDSGSGGNDTPGSGGGTTPPDGEMIYLNPVDYETEEYYLGNFLAPINASTAYSRLYGVDESERLSSYLENVKVGVLDTGVYEANREFGNTYISGFNQDYGPCRGDNRTNCWYFDNGEAIINVNNPEGEGQVSYFYRISQEKFDEWAAEYNEDYVWSNSNFNPELPIVVGGSITNSDSMHGTHVAGIIAADKNEENMHGVAFSNASIIAGRWDLKTPATTAINKMVDKGAQIINMSFGADATQLDASLLDGLSQGDIEYEYINYLGLDEDFFQGVRTAAANNVVLVMAAGNENHYNPGLHNGVPLLTEFSETLKNLFVTVVATDSRGKIASYSNKCGVAKEYCIAAPGGKEGDMIWSTGTYGELMLDKIGQDTTIVGMVGTSMAAPVVSGSIALLMGAYPYLTPKQIVELMFETANKTGEYANEDIYGQGMLDLGEATNPQGYLGTFGGNNVGPASDRVNIASSSITVPAVFKEALVSNMPKSLTAFDKYNRPFAVNFASLVRTTHSGEKNFKNDLYNFTRRQPKQTVQADGFSFGFAPSSYNNTDSGLGIIDVAYEGELHKTSFFFAENSQYSSGSYT
ncbi:MAG: S8 family serine peptidase, partial [Alphaproteobacteria bacterium]|nr:S8 family serine peptidase [Alphaproteobacteria bacterium]